MGWGERWIVDGGSRGGAEIYGVRCPQPSHDISSFARQVKVYLHTTLRGEQLSGICMANNMKTWDALDTLCQCYVPVAPTLSVASPHSNGLVILWYMR